MTYAAGTQGSTYPRPLFQGCRACHVDQHMASSAESRWGDCTACHSESRWAPSPYGVSLHADSPFPLTGAHVVTPCVSCHETPASGEKFTLALPGRQCVDCHEADDPHADLYGSVTCEGCHVTEDWDLARLDHAVLFDGAADAECATCHSVDDPHAGQFEARDCAECHDTEAFTIESFDHDRTSYPLDGAHDDARCASCHATEPGSPEVVRYRPMGTECADCHVGA